MKKANLLMPDLKKAEKKSYNLDWSSFSIVDQNEYIKFANKNFGSNSYQKSSKYLSWLFSNPIEGNEIFVGKLNEESKIEGCLHKMSMEWVFNQEVFKISTIFNLMISKDFRRGNGLRIILKASTDEKHLFIPAVSKNFSNFYEKLRYQRLNSSWYQKILRPVKASLSFLSNSLLSSNKKIILKRKSPLDNYKIDDKPNNKLIKLFSLKLLNSQEKDILTPNWSENLLKWRFFSDDGPKTIAIYEKANSSINNFAFLSLGLRRGVKLLRILEVSYNTQNELKNLFNGIMNFCDCNKVEIIRFCVSNSKIIEFLQDNHWSQLNNGPRSYFYNSPNSNFKEFSKYEFMGGVGDFGFEAIN